MNEVTIPTLCGCTGCWHIATGSGKDSHGHSLSWCNPAHHNLILAQRKALYDARRMVRPTTGHAAQSARLRP